MDDRIELTVSIVLYKENLDDLKKTVACFLKIPLSKKLFLIDNTPNQHFKNIFLNDAIVYISVGKNIGFGSGHNKVISKIKNTSDFHLILNPDVFFEPSIILDLIEELKKDKTLALVSPKVVFPDGTHQYSCRRYPTVGELISRRFSYFIPFFKPSTLKGIYYDKDLNKPFYAAYLTGCFQLYNTADFVGLNGFDERYFLYMEDVDICKKIDVLGKNKLYYPKVSIVHVLKQGSLKKIPLFLRHLSSAIKYYIKWGF